MSKVVGDITCPADTSFCTVGTCPLVCAHIHYLPTVPGNATYAGIFGVLLVAQLVFGIRFKTWGFMVGMICGLILEVVGYIGRIMLHHNPFNFNNFIIYLVPLTIAPAFLAAGVYLCLSRIIVANGSHISRFSPRTYALCFMIFDFISLVLQGAGGGIAATANTNSGSNAGRSIMVAGVVFQVVSLLTFMLLVAEFMWRLRNVPESSKDSRFGQLRATRKFQWFIYAIWIATILIFVRSVYRVAELQQGFGGPIAQKQVLFMILEGPMIFLAVTALTILHPGIAFDGQWVQAGWSLRGRETGKEDSVNEADLMTQKDEA